VYKLLVRTLLFSFDPEWVHYFSLNALKLINKIPLSSWVIRKIYSYENSSLEKELFGVKFKNPVGLAAGFDKNGKYIKELSNLGFGFIEIGLNQCQSSSILITDGMKGLCPKIVLRSTIK
jgi:dihydroorotate dehydrogenase